MHSLSYSLSFYSLIHSPTHSLNHSHILVLTFTLTPSFTHSLTYQSLTYTSFSLSISHTLLVSGWKRRKSSKQTIKILFLSLPVSCKPQYLSQITDFNREMWNSLKRDGWNSTHWWKLDTREDKYSCFILPAARIMHINIAIVHGYYSHLQAGNLLEKWNCEGWLSLIYNSALLAKSVNLLHLIINPTHPIFFYRDPTMVVTLWYPDSFLSHHITL